MSSVGTFTRRHFEPLMLSAQVLIDLAVILFACWLAYQTREYIGWRSPTKLEGQWQLFYLSAAVCLVCFHAFGMYSPIKSLLNIEEFKSIAKATIVAFLVLNVLFFFLRKTDVPPEGPFWSILVKIHRLIDIAGKPERFSRFAVVLSFAFILALTLVSRFVSFKIIQMLHRRGIGNRNVLILGTGQTGRRLQKKFMLVPTLGLNLVGFVSDDDNEVGKQISHSRVVGKLGDLDHLVRQHKISEVFVAMPESTEERVLEIAEVLDRMGVVYHIVPRFYHLLSHSVRIETVDSIPLITRTDRRPGVLFSAGKRAIDLTVALIVLVIGAPFFLIPALLIKRESPGPVFFLQKRVGRDGKLFQMIKFRTMHAHMSGDAPKPKSGRDPRITNIGRWLRRYSLDELPQFLNVLRGEMSVVGPRPEMPFIVNAYGPLERERLTVKPGLTGLWQISYARGEAIHENLEYDIYYIEHQSILLDVVIIALTAFAVVKGTGAY
ncbi:MAG: sugar transferase [Planctomycetes bacterium]|nr:sugar transferase [Planctomycetota bacterium]